MKNGQKIIASIPLLTILLTATAIAQIGEHPDWPSGLPVDTVTVTVDIPGSADGVRTEATIWLMPDGSHDIILDLESSTFTGPGTSVDTTSLAQIFDLLSAEAVHLIVTAGYLDSTLSTNYVDVYVHGWGERIGSGVSTSIRVCNATLFGQRNYACTYQNGVYSTGLNSSSLPMCSTYASGCEPTGAPSYSIE